MSHTYIVAVCATALFAFIVGLCRLLTINTMDVPTWAKWFFGGLIAACLVYLPIVTVAEARSAW